MSEISEWCVKGREQLGLTQVQLAEKAGMSVSTLKLIEGGGAPTMTDLRMLAKYIPTSLDQKHRWLGLKNNSGSGV